MSFSLNTFTCIDYDNGCFVAGAGYNICVSSDNGATWIVSKNASGKVISVNHGNQRFIVSTENGDIYQSGHDIISNYTIAPVNNLVFTALNSGYGSGAQQTGNITITKTGAGDLNNLSVALSGVNATSFEITQPIQTTLNMAVPSTTFTVKAKDGLAGGVYEAFVTISAEHMMGVTFKVTQEVIAPTVSAAISPGTHSFDKKADNQQDVSMNITWNDAATVTEIKKLGTSIGVASYTVSGNTLTIKKQYLASQGVGNLVLSVEFDAGDATILTIVITDTTPPPITPPPVNVYTPPVFIVTPTPIVEEFELTNFNANGVITIFERDQFGDIHATLTLPIDKILQLEAEKGSEEKPLELDIPVNSKVLLKQIQEGKIQSVHITAKIPDTIRKNKRLETKLILSSELLEAAKAAGNELSVSVHDESGRDLYSWIFTGNNLTASKQKMRDVYLELHLLSINSNIKLNELLKGGTQGASGLYLEFEEEGRLPAQTSLKIYVGDRKDVKSGYRMYLYRYNQDSDRLETLPYSSGYIVDKAGYVTVDMIDCSDYVILPKEADKTMITSLRDQIVISPSELTLYIGGTLGASGNIQITIPVALELVKNLKDKTSGNSIGAITVTYSSSDEAVADVSSEGIVTARGIGSATITTKVTLYSGKTKSFVSEINVKEPYVTFTGSTDGMIVGDSFRFELKAYGVELGEVAWTTTRRSIVVISKKSGKATAVSKGTDYVVAKTGDTILKIKVVVR